MNGEEIMEEISKARRVLESTTEMDPRVERVWEKVKTLLDEEGIHYAPVGGIALNLEGAGRPTLDVDLVVKREDWRKAVQILSRLKVDLTETFDEH